MSSIKTSVVIKGLVAIPLVLVSIIGLFIYYVEVWQFRSPHPSDVLEIKYAADGKHIYYIQEFETGIDQWAYKLFYMTPDFKQRELIHNDSPIEGLEVEPSGKYLIFKYMYPEELVLVDAKTGKVVRKLTDQLPDVFNRGWHPDGKRLWYTANGIFLYDLETSRTEKVISSDLIGHSWSRDGRFLLCTTNTSIYKGDKLLLYDTKQNRFSTLLTMPRGEINDALISADNKVYYSVTFKRDDSADLGMVNMDGSKRTVLWSQKRIGSDQITIGSLQITANGRDLLFDVITGEIGKSSVAGTYLMSGLTCKVERQIPPSYIGPELWDYSPITNRLVWYDSYTKTFKAKHLE